MGVYTVPRDACWCCILEIVWQLTLLSINPELKGEKDQNQIKIFITLTQCLKLGTEFTVKVIRTSTGEIKWN